MKKTIASLVIAALLLGSAATPALAAAAPARNGTEITEGNKRPNSGPGNSRPTQPQPGNNRPMQQQPGRPGTPPASQRPQQPGHRPPAPQPSHRPDYRPSNNHRPSSSGSNFGWGVIVGALIGSALTQASHR